MSTRVTSAQGDPCALSVGESCYPSRNFQHLKALQTLKKAPASWLKMRKMMRNGALMRLKPICTWTFWALMNVPPTSGASSTRARKVEPKTACSLMTLSGRSNGNATAWASTCR